MHDDVMPLTEDSVLFGSWLCALVNKGNVRILDVGTGSGILSLIAAQHNSSAFITGIDNTVQAVAAASTNFRNSAFTNRLECVYGDFFEYFIHNHAVDIIMCNPPYYVNGYLPESVYSANQKHASNFPFDRFFEKSYELSTGSGKLSIIVPERIFVGIVKSATKHAWHLSHLALIQRRRKIGRNRVLAIWDKVRIGETPTRQIFRANGRGIFEGISSEMQQIIDGLYVNPTSFQDKE